MKTKYQTAYYDTLDTFLSIADVQILESTSQSSHKRNLTGHLWCPECKKVMFSIVHIGNELSHFRGYPQQEHEKGCSYGLPEIRIKTVAELKQQDPSYEKVNLQMQRVLRYTEERSTTRKSVSPSITPLKDKAISGKTVHKKADIRLPEKRIDLPLSDDDLNTTKVFYGTVLLTSSAGTKNPNEHFLTLLSLDKKERICVISISEMVWRYLSVEPLLNGKQVKVRISFCGELKKSATGTKFCTLRHSKLLIVQPS